MSKELSSSEFLDVLDIIESTNKEYEDLYKLKEFIDSYYRIKEVSPEELDDYSYDNKISVIPEEMDRVLNQLKLDYYRTYNSSVIPDNEIN